MNASLRLLVRLCVGLARLVRCPRRRSGRDRRSRRRLAGAAGQQPATSRSSPTRCAAPRATSSTGAPSTGPRSSSATTRAAGRARWPTTSASATAASPTPGPQLPFMIAACDAPDGSHWALQQWQRLWRNYGGDRARQRALHLALARRHRPSSQIQTDYSYHGKHQHLWGKFTFHGKPVFGTHWTLKGVPHRQAGPQHLRRLPQGPAVAPGQQLPDPSADGGLLLHVREPPGRRRRPGTARARATPTAPRPSARASRRSCRRTSRRPARTRPRATTPPTPRSSSCSATTRAAASTSERGSDRARRLDASPSPIQAPQSVAGRAARAPMQSTRVPGSSASWPRGSAGSPTPMAVPGPASNVSSPTVKRARPEITTKSSCWRGVGLVVASARRAPAARPRAG